jgi:hypothetical protein
MASKGNQTPSIDDAESKKALVDMAQVWKLPLWGMLS